MRYAIYLFCGLMSWMAAALAAEEPRLVLDTGGHMATIRSVVFTPDGRQLISASDDKTIRVWDLATGRTVRTFRGEIAPGNPGKIFAMALSPDGRWLAAGGWLGGTREESDAVRLYDFASGRLVALLKGHAGVVNGLAFSPDGRHLISGGGDNTAIIWDVEGRRMEHELRGHGAETYAVGFTPDSARAVTGSYDHQLRIWRVSDGAEIARMSDHRDKVRSLAVARDGTIASGDESGEIRLWDSRTGALRKVLARQSTGVDSLNFSPDGTTLLSGFGDGTGFECHVYDIASGRETVTYRGHDDVVIATAISPDGRWAATGGGNRREIHVWDLKTGERRAGPDGQPLSLGGQGQSVWAVGFSPDGRRIGWGNLWETHTTLGKNPLQHLLALPSAADPLPRPEPLTAAQSADFRRAITSQGGWSLQHRKGGSFGYDAFLDIQRDGKVVATIERGSTDGYRHLSYSFTPDGASFVSGGGNGWLTIYDRSGRNLGDFIGHESDVWAEAPSSDGRLLVSGAADQTVRLWNLKTRDLLATLFYGLDGEWVMWTPGGYYMGSTGGEKLVGWHINRGTDKEADFFPVGQFRAQYYRPDIVALTVELGNEADAVARANKEAKRREAEGVQQQLPPVITINGPADGGTFSGQTLSIDYSLRSPSGLPVTRVRALIDGRPVEGAETKGFVPMPASADSEVGGRLSVPMPPRDAVLSLIAETGRATSVPATLRLRWAGMTEADLRKGVLYALVVGVNQYKDTRIPSLSWAVADAREFAATLATQKGGLYRDVQTKVLLDDKARRSDVIDGLEWLKRAVSQGDVGVVFLSGHGATDASQKYFFAPSDAELDPDAALSVPKRSSAVPDTEIVDTLKSLRGNALFFFDTCHAGRAAGIKLKGASDLRPFVAELQSAQNGVIALASSDGTELSQERDEWKHGAFTKALLEGLGGKADLVGNDGVITVDELGLYVKDRVKQLTGGQQHPVDTRPQETRNIAFASVRH